MANLEEFLAELASAQPTPGGGSAAALAAAAGAALVSMVANLTVGRRRFGALQPEIERALAQAEGLRARGLHLMEEDARAYDEVAAAWRLPRTTSREREERAVRIQAALKAAVQPPLELMTVAAELVRLAGGLIGQSNPSVVSDLGVATALARAAFEGGRFNVEVNLVAVEDGDWVQAVQARLVAGGDIEAEAAQVLAQVRSAIWAGT